MFSKSDCQRLAKKAIVTSLQNTYRTQRCPENEALCPVRIQLDNDIVTISLDTTGSSLSNRGYRSEMGKAPLRETLAAGLILLSRWRPDLEPMMDPFCGSGTLLIEAAMIAQNMAPGLNRRLSEDWELVPNALWTQTSDEAEAAIKPLDAVIIGSDSSKACQLARENCERAGIDNIHIQELSATDIRSSHKKRPYHHQSSVRRTLKRSL